MSAKPTRAVVYQQAPAHGLRALLRLASGRKQEPTAAIIDSRTPCSAPDSATPCGGMTAPNASAAPRCVCRGARWAVC